VGLKNLCDNCLLEFGSCESRITFGTSDNVIDCNRYRYVQPKDIIVKMGFSNLNNIMFTRWESGQEYSYKNVPRKVFLKLTRCRTVRAGITWWINGRYWYWRHDKVEDWYRIFSSHPFIVNQDNWFAEDL